MRKRWKDLAVYPKACIHSEQLQSQIKSNQIKLMTFTFATAVQYRKYLSFLAYLNADNSRSTEAEI